MRQKGRGVVDVPMFDGLVELRSPKFVLLCAFSQILKPLKVFFLFLNFLYNNSAILSLKFEVQKKLSPIMYKKLI